MLAAWLPTRHVILFSVTLFASARYEHYFEIKAQTLVRTLAAPPRVNCVVQQSFSSEQAHFGTGEFYISVLLPTTFNI